MIGEGGADVMTKPVDFKIAPEVLEQRNFTPLPDFRKPVIESEPSNYEEPSRAVPDMSDMPPELRKIMEDIKKDGVKDNHDRPIPEKKEKPKGFWAKLTTAIKNFFRNLFR